ncbi:sigma-70 family RNA polymerase sigma factor [Streptomyces sp. NBC_01016]|uniref:RNA polymerase sigma factor n=1 Tax=Streptomyces sp. NBC_01016 TaxID=2903720 RepID=UPI00225127BB|nr:sigma-70 family RNA polymerase sigma factor [Streptomyces sp. NBC_01016]MCX4831191.1 sigma-70 family RNA polymerase sigma factor [Streptomyces sp. NBC_01016]
MRVDETQLTAALDGNSEAITVILRELDRLIRARARRINRQHAEDLAQEGREALWQCLSRFDGVTPEHFVNYAAKTVTGAMMDAHCAMHYLGLSLDEAKLWRSAYKHAKGDADEAERLLSSGELAWRMSPATAKVVRAAVSPVGEMPEELATPEPAEPSEGDAGRSSGRVAWMLLTLGEQQRSVLEMTYGIGKYGCMTDSEIAVALGVPKGHVASARSKALKRLRDRSSRSFLLH